VKFVALQFQSVCPFVLLGPVWTKSQHCNIKSYDFALSRSSAHIRFYSFAGALWVDTCVGRCRNSRERGRSNDPCIRYGHSAIWAVGSQAAARCAPLLPILCQSPPSRASQTSYSNPLALIASLHSQAQGARGGALY